MGGDAETILLLLARGAKVDPADEKQLAGAYYAAWFGQDDALRALLKAGANPNRGVGGWTPLHGAARRGQLAALDMLAKAGADVNAHDEDGSTPLMVAAGAGRVSAVKALLALGAKPGLKDDKGRTAIDHARANKRGKVVEILASLEKR